MQSLAIRGEEQLRTHLASKGVSPALPVHQRCPTGGCPYSRRRDPGQASLQTPSKSLLWDLNSLIAMSINWPLAMPPWVAHLDVSTPERSRGSPYISRLSIGTGIAAALRTGDTSHFWQRLRLTRFRGSAKDRWGRSPEHSRASAVAPRPNRTTSEAKPPQVAKEGYEYQSVQSEVRTRCSQSLAGEPMDRSHRRARWKR